MLKKYTLSILCLLFAFQISFAGPSNAIPNFYILQMNASWSPFQVNIYLGNNYGISPNNITGPLFATNTYLVYQSPTVTSPPQNFPVLGDDIQDAQLSSQIDTWPDGSIVGADFNYEFDEDPNLYLERWQYDINDRNNPCHDIYYNAGAIESAELKAAVFDTGLEPNHDLFDNYLNTEDAASWGRNYVEGIEFAPRDENGHGTAISSIVLRNFHEENPFLNLDLQNDQTHADDGVGDLWTMMVALDDAIQSGVNVVNMSYSYFADYKYRNIVELPIYQLLNYAEGKGVLCVVAAGNDKANLDNQEEKSFYPAAFPHDNILTVGAMFCNGVKAGFSNYGSASVDIFANGWRVKALDMNGSWIRVRGTSPAAALVTAAALQLGTYQNQFDYEEVKCAIMNGAVNNGELGQFCVSGGYVNIENALPILGNCENQGFARITNDDVSSHNFDGSKMNLNIETNSLQNVSVAIFDAMGHQVAHYPAEMIEGEKTISIEVPTESPQGIYFARIFMDNRMKTIKFFKYDLR